MPIYKDYAGLNLCIYDPLEGDSGSFSEANTVGYNPSTKAGYWYTDAAGKGNVSSITEIGSTSRTLALLNLHRNGPYGWPTWQQIRGSNNPLFRLQRRSNIFTYVETPGPSRNFLANEKEYSQTDRFGGIKKYTEPCISSDNHPLALYVGIEGPVGEGVYTSNGWVMDAEIKTTFGNDVQFFANEELNRHYDTVQITDDSYDNLKDLYLDGRLDDDDSPIKSFRMLIYKQTVWPKVSNSFLNKTRTRTFFVNEFWRTNREDRKRKDIVMFNQPAQSQSMWPLDVASDWADRTWVVEDVISSAKSKYYPYIGGSTQQQGMPASGAPIGPVDMGVLMNKASHFTTFQTRTGLITGINLKVTYLGDQVVDEEMPCHPNASSAQLKTSYTAADHEGQFSARCTYAMEHTLRNSDSTFSRSEPVIYPYSSNGYIRGSGSSGYTHYASNPMPIKVMFGQGDAMWDAPSQAGFYRPSSTGFDWIEEKVQPFYDSYSDYSYDTKLQGQGYSILPEFRISNHVETYLSKGVTEELKSIFELSGGLARSSNTNNTDNFYEIFSNSDFLKNFEIIKKDHEGFTSPSAITLRCKGLKKFLPYKGFYPADRTVEMAEQFHKSYGQWFEATGSTFGSFPMDLAQSFQSKAATQLIMEPMFSPGILFNTIKAGVACDFPVFTEDNRLVPYEVDYFGNPDRARYTNHPRPLADPLFGIGSNGWSIHSSAGNNWYQEEFVEHTIVCSTIAYKITEMDMENQKIATPLLDTMYSKRIPFEALIEPERHLAKIALSSNNPARNSVGFPWSYQFAGEWSGNGDNLYKKLAHNFLAEVPEFFLQGQNFSTISSLENSNPEFGNAVAGTYYTMRVKMYKTINGSRDYLPGFDNLKVPVPQIMNGRKRRQRRYSTSDDAGSILGKSNFFMYSRPSAFGPPASGWTGEPGTAGWGFWTFNQPNRTLLSKPTMDYYERNFDSSNGVYSPYTPPYYDGEGWCDLIFYAKETRKYTLDEILSSVKEFPYYTRFWWNGTNDAIRDLTGYNRPSQCTDGNGGNSWPGRGSTHGTHPKSIYWVMPYDWKGKYEEYKDSPWAGLIFDKKGSKLTRDSVGAYDTWENVDPNDFGNKEYDDQNFTLGPFPWGSDPVGGINTTAGINYYSRKTGQSPLPPVGTSWANYTYTDGWWQCSGAYANPPATYATSKPSAEFEQQVQEENWQTLVPGGGTRPYQIKTKDFGTYYYIPQHPFYINYNAMQLNSSVNLFTKGIVQQVDLSGDLTRRKQAVATSETNDARSRWIIQSKFETPILNFYEYRGERGNPTTWPNPVTMPLNATGQAVPRGMWHQYGRLPKSSEEGIFLQVGDIPRAWLKGALGVGRARWKTASLADLCGFSKKPVRLGEVAAVKQIGELVVAVPFTEVGGTRKFFSMPRRDINEAVDGLNSEVSPGVYVTPSGAPKASPDVGNSVLHQTRMMRKYVFPPSMDFVQYEEITPFAMYCFEFTENLSKTDLSNIWQNLPPKIGRTLKEAEATISHQLLAKDLMGGGASFEKQPGSNRRAFDRNEPGQDLPANVQWMVFKCKQKAASNYFDKVLTEKGETESQKSVKLKAVKATRTGTDSSITFNWPYDYFSLVELVKIDAEIVFADLEPEAEAPEAKVKRSSKDRRNARKAARKQKRLGIGRKGGLGKGNRKSRRKARRDERRKRRKARRDETQWGTKERRERRREDRRANRSQRKKDTKKNKQDRKDKRRKRKEKRR